MKEKDAFDYTAESLMDNLILLEQKDPQQAFDELAANLRREHENGWMYGEVAKAQTKRPLKLEIWCVQRKPLNADASKYRFLELAQNKKEATDTAVAYNNLAADCEYRAWLYMPRKP